jgi:hypothetical protein
MRFWLHLGGILLVLSGLAALLQRAAVAHQLVDFPLTEDSVQFIPTAQGDLYGLVWLATGEIAGIWSPVGGGTPNYHFTQVDRDGPRFTRIPLPLDLPCPVPNESFATSLSEGRVGVILACAADSSFPRHLLAYDPVTQAVARIGEIPVEFYPWSFSASPQQDRTILHVQPSRGREGIYWLQADGLERLDWSGWRPGTDIAILEMSNPRSGSPLWSPDGTAIAVMFDHLGNGYPPSRRASPMQLLLLGPDGQPSRVLVDGITNFSGGLTWSPDGRWLAAVYQWRGTHEGVWIVEVATGRHAQVLTGPFYGAVAWSPDGERLVATVGDHLDIRPGARDQIGLQVVQLPSLAQAFPPRSWWESLLY